MAETTIEWTRGPRGELGYTFNGWIGCEKISPGCDNCYAAAQDQFRSWTPEGWGGPRKRTSEANWKLPTRWNAAAAAAGERRRVFCSSLADVFDNQVPNEWRADLFTLIRNTPNLDWLLLTKRVGNAKAMIEQATRDQGDHGDELAGWPWPNVWLGATVVNQGEADRDIPKLLATPARVRFLSCEPLLGPVDLRCLRLPSEPGTLRYMDAVDRSDGARGLDWVIVGGESGHGARPMHPAWARSLRDQCAAAGVPFLFKQWGEWIPAGQAYAFKAPIREFGYDEVNCHRLHRIGKKAAGRLLDGVTHDGFPEVR
ncbi:MAG: phage Gp37/Gp68 family protein [Variovorax sp.]|nr:phage Gp37/Gp68 family protein [Variovorax sp.]